MMVKFQVGDWSSDGHGRCETFMVECDRTLEELRETHFSCIERFDFDIGDICKKYEENSIIRDSELYNKLCKIGLNLIDFCDSTDCNFDVAEKEAKEYYLLPGHVFKLWIAILNKLNPELNLVQIDSDTIHFYGYDEKKRHLNTPGYGCFMD